MTCAVIAPYGYFETQETEFLTFQSCFSMAHAITS